jgi:hypothetical protein
MLTNMFASPIETGIAPSGTLLGLLQRGRGDGWLHALAAPRPTAVAALEHCVLHDPRRDWRLEHRSLYYARLYRELNAGLDAVADHLFHPGDLHDDDGEAESAEERTGLALSVLGHLTSYGDRQALELLRRYAVTGANWRWALDELAVRDDDAGLRALGPRILVRFAHTEAGERALTAAVRDSFEPRPWRIWAEDPARPEQRARLGRALTDGDFDRWQRQMRPPGPQPGWSVAAVLAWAQDGCEQTPRHWREAPAARCLAAAAAAPDPDVSRAAVTAFSRMNDRGALVQARRWAVRPDELGSCAAAMLARRGETRDAPGVLAALRRAVRTHGPDARELRPLVEGAGRLDVIAAVPVLRHIYRETASSQLRGHTARALAVTDASFASGFAVECLWDCEEDTRELAARFATTGDVRVVERLRRLATDPAEQAGVQTAVRGRLADRAVG